MLGKTCEDRKTYTSMCDVVADFWCGMNAAEVALGRPELPKLKVEPGEGDETQQPKAKPKAKGKAAPSGQSLQLRSGTISTDVDDASFLERGFKVDAVIERLRERGSDEPSVKLIIKSVGKDGEPAGQDVTVKVVGKDDEPTTMKRCQIVDCYTVVDTTVKTKAARFRVVVRVRVGVRV